jgi:4-aminobutyrate aminotransferase
MGKALSGGLPLAAVASGERFLGAWPAGMHTSTFQGNPLACAMAVATLGTIGESNLLAYVRDAIEPILMSLRQLLLRQHGVADVRIAGAQAAIVFHDIAGQPDPNRVATLQRALLDRHVLAYGGGRSGECLMLVPPLTIDRQILWDTLLLVASLVGATA